MIIIHFPLDFFKLYYILILKKVNRMRSKKEREKLKEKFSNTTKDIIDKIGKDSINSEKLKQVRKDLIKSGFSKWYVSRYLFSTLRDFGVSFLGKGRTNKSSQSQEKERNFNVHSTTETKNPSEEIYRPIKETLSEIKQIYRPIKETLSETKQALSKLNTNINNTKEEAKMPEEKKIDINEIIKKVSENLSSTIAKTVPSMVSEELDRRELEKRRKEEERRKKEEEQKIRQQAEEAMKLAKENQKVTEEAQKAINAFCELNPDDPRCKNFVTKLTDIVKEAVKETKEVPVEVKKIKEEESSEKKKSIMETALEKLEPMTPEKRRLLSKEEQKERDDKIQQIFKKLNITPVDAWRYINSDEISRRNIPNKPEIREAVLRSMSEEEIMTALKTCVGSECTLLKREIDKRSGKEKYLVKDKEGWRLFEADNRPHF